MKVGVWGAGSIGAGLAYRLTTLPVVSELVWINRTIQKIEKQVIDLTHGLSFAPTCHTVRACEQAHAAREMPTLDLLVLTLGASVKEGETRDQKYPVNAGMLRESVLPALQAGFKGIILVITNPVDLVARLVHVEGGVAADKVLGLGTVVETARLRSSLASYLSPRRAPRDVRAYAVGTHDPQFVPIVNGEVAAGDNTPGEVLEGIVECARREVANGAERVKTGERSSLHPIVEGAVEVIEAIGLNKRSALTVSVLDPDSGEDKLFYSMPCTVGRDGNLRRFDDILGDSAVRDQISRCCDSLRAVLQAADELPRVT
ncbi:MAG: hypothetical protein ISS31_04065 [Kiritimatiellae bacterium]|nr:hypothetical protein [Kiritimatiellia bacterium]